MKIILTRIISFLSSLLVFSSILVWSPSMVHADVIQEDECFPAVLILRGSDEARLEEERRSYLNSSNGLEYLKTNGYEGEILSRLLQAFVDETDPSVCIVMEH